MNIIKSIEELNAMKLKGGGIIPFAKNNGKTYFLLGKEAPDPFWKEANHWSCFGGAIEEKNNLVGIVREFWEETNGIFGSEKNILEFIKKNFSKLFVITNGIGATIFIQVNYDPYLVDYYRNTYNFMKDIMTVKRKGLLEKDEIKWFKKSDFHKYKLRKNMEYIIECVKKSKFF